MVAVGKRHVDRKWMSSSETLLSKERFSNESLPRLKPIDEYESIDKQSIHKQPKLRGASLLPPITTSVVSGSTMAHSTSASPPPSTILSSAVRDAAHRFLLRNNVPTLSSSSSPSQHINNLRGKRTSLYDHVQSKINTGLPRTESIARTETDTYRLGPVRPLSWRVMKQELEQDIHLRAQAKRIQLRSNPAYIAQLKGLGELVRSKVRSHISSVMGFGEERYKIVVHMTVFEPTVSGLHVASRCLWNTMTDNSITLRMQGVDCDFLIVIFGCYTDLGAAQI